MIMKDKVLVLKNPTLIDYKELPISVIHSIIPINDENGNLHLLINFYDDEFCVDAHTFCDEIIEIK